MPKNKGKKVYAVAKGRKTGIFQTWDECKAQVDKFQNAQYKSFKTRPEALAYLQKHQSNGGVSVASTDKQGDSRKRKEIQDAGATNNIHTKKSRAEPSTDNVTSNPYSSGSLPAGSATSPGLIFNIHFDGGSRGNPGVAGAGAEVVLSRATRVSAARSTNKRASSTKRIQQAQTRAVVRRLCKTLIRHYLGDTFTNNQAEYQGLICGLQNVLDTLKSKRYPMPDGQPVTLIVQGDSKLIIQQIKGIYDCKSPKIQSYYRSAKELIKSIHQECLEDTGHPCKLTLEHVYRESNKVADSLANNAMDAKRSWTTKYEEDDGDDEKHDNTNDERVVDEDVQVIQTGMIITMDKDSIPAGTRLV